jgi:hypothetical protein
MFSFRTTTLFDQLDNSLLKGKIAVMRSPSAWYPVVESYLWELVALKWDLRLVVEPENLNLEFLKNYDLNMKFFSMLDKKTFDTELMSFLKQNKNFVEFCII